METWKAAICKPSREASEETTPASTEILGTRKTENFCWLGHLVRGALWWRPLLTDTARSPTRPAELPNVGPAGGGAAVTSCSLSPLSGKLPEPESVSPTGLFLLILKRILLHKE